MKLSNVEISPGVIVDAKDPEKLGRVKINAPALMRGNESGDHFGVVDKIDNNVLPWIYPMMMNRYQMFSKELEGMKVWVINNTENYNEYWYIPMFDYIDVTEEIVSEKYDNDVEVIISRKNGDGAARIYYDREGGHVIHINDYKWNMMPNGDITCHGDQGDIDIRGGHVYMGRNTESYEPAVFGDELVNLFQELSDICTKLVSSHSSEGDTKSAALFQELALKTSKAYTSKIKTINTSVN